MLPVSPRRRLALIWRFNRSSTLDHSEGFASEHLREPTCPEGDQFWTGKDLQELARSFLLFLTIGLSSVSDSDEACSALTAVRFLLIVLLSLTLHLSTARPQERRTSIQT